MKKRTIEVFTAGCPLCEAAVNEVQSLACGCDVIIHDLAAGCETNVCRDKAKEYGVTSVPAVAIDGKLASCCERSGINLDVLRAA